MGPGPGGRRGRGLSMRSALDSSPAGGRAGRERRRAVWEEGRERGGEEERGRAAEGGGGEADRPAGGAGGLIVDPRGGPARPAPRLSPQSPTRSRRFGPQPPAVGHTHAAREPASPLSLLHGEAAKIPSSLGICLHLFTFTYYH